MLYYQCIKEDSQIKGYWQDKEGKIFIDNIKIIEIKNYFLLYEYILKAFENGEKACFVVNNDKAYIYYDNGQIEVLTKHKILEYTLENFNLENLLKEYNGFTCFYNAEKVIVSIWTK